MFQHVYHVTGTIDMSLVQSSACLFVCKGLTRLQFPLVSDAGSGFWILPIDGAKVTLVAASELSRIDIGTGPQMESQISGQSLTFVLPVGDRWVLVGAPGLSQNEVPKATAQVATKKSDVPADSVNPTLTKHGALR